MNERLKDAGRLLADTNADALLVWNMTNVRYLSGFTGTEGALLIGREYLFFLTDSRYKTQAENQAAKFEYRISNDKIKNIASALEDMGAKALAFEDETLTVRQKAQLAEAMPDVEFIALGSKLDDLRLRKDSSELDIMRKAALISEKGFQKAIETIQPGVSEKKVATELEIGMLRNGASGPSFETIVASGHRGALPHGVASAKLIEKGELIVIDFGCVYMGYCSDQTVTVACGDIGQEEEKVYDIVREAQANAMEALKPGVRLKDVDAVARNFISQAGYGEYFGHGLGHGVGMNVHEAPRLNSESETIAQEGMVITVEPGIYLPGRFGVRIEDTMIVTATGCQRITNLDKSLRRL
jgi:Xaa-Pro aminopeptidase